LFGTKFLLELKDRNKVEGYLIHFPTFIKIASAFGLKYLEITNLEEFFQAYKREFYDIIMSMGVFKPGMKIIEPHQLQVLRLFAVFVFMKVDRKVLAA